MELEGFSDLEPGLYFVDPDGDDTTPLRVTYQVAAEGWSQWFGAVKFTDAGHTALSITTVTNLVSDGCRDRHPARPSRRADRRRPRDRAEPARPVRGDRTADRRDALRLRGEAPRADRARPAASRASGTPPSSRTASTGTSTAGSPRQREGPSTATTREPGETEEFWILDVDGTRLVLVKYQSPPSPPQDVAERDAIFDTIQHRALTPVGRAATTTTELSSGSHQHTTSSRHGRRRH